MNVNTAQKKQTPVVSATDTGRTFPWNRISHHVLILVALVLSGYSALAQSGSYATRATTKKAVPIAPLAESPVITFTPTKLEGESSIQLISSPPLTSLGQELIANVREIHREFNRLFGVIMRVSNTLRLIDAEEFYAVTHLPTWTNAMFFRGQVVIPIDRSRPIVKQDLERSLRHEYFHAITHTLSKGRCPGWLDEGLAQDMEGLSHASLWSALSRWLQTRDIVPFNRLARGFTKLPSEMVAPAYAQSLVAARMIRAQFGMPAIRSYLERLSRGDNSDVAFRVAFGIPPAAFHQRVRQNLLSGRFKRDDYH